MRLERGGLLAVLRQSRHKRERRIGENTKDFGVVGGDGIKFVCHDYSIVPDKLHGSPFDARNTTRARCLTHTTRAVTSAFSAPTAL